MDSRTDQVVTPYQRSNSVPSTLSSVVSYLNEQLRNIQKTLGDITGSSNGQVVNAAPAHPRRGQTVYAISPWNPGSGEGLYVYKGSSVGWKFIA